MHKSSAKQQENQGCVKGGIRYVVQMEAEQVDGRLSVFFLFFFNLNLNFYLADDFVLVVGIDFDNLVKAYVKAKAVVQKEGTPRIYVKALAELEDFVKDVSNV